MQTFICGLACSSMIGLLFAAEARGETIDLLKAYEAALTHDPTHRAAQAARDAGAEEENIARAQLLPSISAVYSTDRNSLRAREREILRSSGRFDSSSSTSSSTTSSSTGRTRTDGAGTASTDINTDTSSTRTQSESSASTGNLDSISDDHLSQTDRIRTTGASIQLRQPLFDMNRVAGYRQGVALSAASESDFRARSMELMIRVSEAYASVLFAQESRRLALSQLETLAGQQQMNERMLVRGEGTVTDVLETTAKRELAQAQLIEADDELLVASNLLASITGLRFSSLAPLRTDVDLAAQSELSPQQWRNWTLEYNGLLEALRHQISAAREEARRAESGHLPTVDLTLTLGRDLVTSRPLSSQSIATSSSESSTGRSNGQSSTESTSRNEAESINASSTVSSQSSSSSSSSRANASDTSRNDYNRRRNTSHRIGLELNIPIFAGGGISARARQAAARLLQVQAEADARTEEVLLEVQRQLRVQQSAAQRARALAQAVTSSQVAIEATIKSTAAGVRTNLDVLNARERLTAAERELLTARYTHLLAYLRLRYHAGTLSHQDLAKVSSVNASPR